MTEIGYRYGVCALRAKRAEIAGEIGQIRLQLRRRQQDLAKVDDILRILDPGSDSAKIPAKKPVKYTNLFRQGELGRLILAVLRASGRPTTNLEILAALMEKIGAPPDARESLRRRVTE